MAKLENAVLRGPTTHSSRVSTKKGSRTIGTSGHFIYQGSVAAESLLPFIKILKKEDTTMYMSKEKYLGEGRFGTCHFNHYKVCVKTFKTHLDTKLMHCQNLIIQTCHTFLVLLLEKSYH